MSGMDRKRTFLKTSSTAVRGRVPIVGVSQFEWRPSVKRRLQSYPYHTAYSCKSREAQWRVQLVAERR